MRPCTASEMTSARARRFRADSSRQLTCPRMGNAGGIALKRCRTSDSGATVNSKAVEKRQEFSRWPWQSEFGWFLHQRADALQQAAGGTAVEHTMIEAEGEKAF